MFLQPYRLDELHFAYVYRVYFRWRTHRAKPYSPLASLDQTKLSTLVSKYGIDVLECASDETNLLAEVSLKPTESISACASKLKGQTSKWLREALQMNQPTDLLSRGYFACTNGRSTREATEQYLESQGEHHGYANRTLPPVLVQDYELGDDDRARICPRHAFVIARFHLVLATSKRLGLFGSQQGRSVAAAWRRAQCGLQIALTKVSFVPDHVHLAVQTHPAVSPTDVVLTLMNAAQEVMSEELVSAKIDRLWQPSAYIGAYGDLASPQIRKYLENWETSRS